MTSRDRVDFLRDDLWEVVPIVRLEATGDTLAPGHEVSRFDPVDVRYPVHRGLDLVSVGVHINPYLCYTPGRFAQAGLGLRDGLAPGGFHTRPLRIIFPGVFPVICASRTINSPFTKTSVMPVGY